MSEVEITQPNVAPEITTPDGAVIQPDAGKPNEASATHGEPEKKQSLDDVIAKAEAKAKEASDKAEAVAKAKTEADDKAKQETKKPNADAKPDVDADARAKEAANKAKADAEAAEGKPDAEGKAKPKFDAPSRFDEAAKADWDKAPDTVKGATTRAIREIEQGIEKYREAATAYEDVKEFDELARRNGNSLRGALERVSAIEDAFAKNPIEGFQKVADHFGISLHALAAHVMGETPDKNRVQIEGQFAQLRNENAALRSQLQQAQQTAQRGEYNNTLSQVQQFRQDHPRFEELHEQISDEISLLKTANPDMPRMKLLEKAYDRADRMYPATNVAAQTRTDALDDKSGAKSISGAPASGSDPTIPSKRRGKPSSIDDSLDRAFARLS